MNNIFTPFYCRAIALCSFIFFAGLGKANGQGLPITEIITNYNTYFKSNASAVNAVKPDNSHDLLAFKFNGIRYSTGVNDALLTTKGDGFTAEDFRGLPLQSLTGIVDTSTKLALGAMYDGVANGPSSPAPVNNLSLYLSDGAKGLNLGTGISNLPMGILNFGVSGFNTPGIGDGIPDILVTQIADPATTSNDYEFIDASGFTVGNIVTVTFDGISPVANWTTDFYEASTNPATLSAANTQIDHSLRLWAADLSAFGISSVNASTIVGFRIHVNGPSDIAFVGFNNATFHALPIKLNYFTAKLAGIDAKLLWQTETEINSKYFVIESKMDGQQFKAIDTVAAAGNSSIAKNYAYLNVSPGAGTHYYRLKEIDIDGKVTYSTQAQVTIAPYFIQLAVYPNPTTGRISATHPAAQEGDKLELFSIIGAKLFSINAIPGATQTNIKLPAVPTGMYVLRYLKINGDRQSLQLLVQ